MKIMKQKIFVLPVLVTIVFSSLLVSCAPSEVEQTNRQLTVAFYGVNDAVKRQIAEYKVQHPNIEVVVDYEELSNEQGDEEDFFKRISTEIMSGKGADLIIMESRSTNANKMMHSQVFANLSDFFNDDETYKAEEYNQIVLNAGKFEDKQYIVPLTYTLPLLLTTQELLNETGFDISASNNYLDFMGECERYDNFRSSEMPSLIIRTPVTMRPYFWALKGDALNYKTEEVKLNTPGIKEAIMLNQKAITSKYFKDGMGELSYGGVFGALGLQKKVALFDHSTIHPLEYHILNYRAIKDFATPVHFALKNLDGEIAASIETSAAINANSSNKQNAYDLLRMIMSPKAQERLSYSGQVFISNTAVKDYLNQFREDESLVLGSGHTGDFKTLKGLSQEDIDSYMSILESIDTAYFSEVTTKEIFREMTPFLSGEKDYEECLKNAQAKLEIYLSE